MADNVTLDAGAGGANIAADEATYSGDTTQVQLVRLVHVTGAEGAKTISELVYAEDAAHSSGHFGFQALAVRTDTPANRSGADGDYEPLQVAAGRLWVDASGVTLTVASHAVTNAGTFAVQAVCTNAGTFAVQTGAERAEDAAHSTGHTGLFVLAVRSDTAASTGGTDGDYVALVSDSTGRLHCNVSNTLTVASHAVTNAGTFAVQVDAALPAGTNAIGKLAANSGVDIGDVDVTSIVPGTGATSLGKAIDTALGATDTGVLALTVRDDALATLTEADGDVSALRVDSTGRLWCNVSNTVTVGSHAVTNAGTFAVQVDGSALTALQLIDDPVFADDAAFTVGTSKVMVAGGIVDDDSTDAADEGDAVAFRATKERKQRVVAALDSAAMQSGNDEVTPKFAIIDAATSGDNTLVAAVASKKIRVLSLWLVAAGTVNVRFESGAAGTALSGQANLVVNAGFVLPFNPVGWFETAANTLLNLELSAAISVDGGLTYIECD